MIVLGRLIVNSFGVLQIQSFVLELQRNGLRVAVGYYYSGRNGESWQRREVIGQALLAMSSGFALPVLATTGTGTDNSFPEHTILRSVISTTKRKLHSPLKVTNSMPFP